MKAWTALLLPLLAAANPLATTSQAADSKIAKNVLESKGEGYCSVSLTPFISTWLNAQS